MNISDWLKNRNFVKNLGLITGPAIAILIFLFFKPDPLNSKVGFTAGIALLMAIWWITEAIPLAVTALIPVVLFPLLGVMDGRDLSSEYFNDVIFLFLGGFIVALAMQRWNLHKRIALITLLIFGTKPKQILLGFMVSTAFLSMWISNTATAMMMVPIALSVIMEVEQSHDSNLSDRFSIAVLLGIAYSASIGGIATLVGTPPNLVFLRIFSMSFPEAPEISFTNWFMFAFPISLVFLIIAWIYLSRIITKVKFDINRASLKLQYSGLGKISYEEKVVLLVFVLLVVAWLTRSDLQLGKVSIKGWASLFKYPKFINDGTIAILFSSILFIIPAKKTDRIMVWKDTRDLPWNIVLLFGGGFALAKAFQVSGLSLWFGEQFSGLSNLNPILIIFIICLIVSFLTELTSNTATSQVILPILAPLSIVLMKNPLLFMIPVTLASSLAFMMPVATPPNAIVFGTKRIKISQMVRYGFWLNMIGVTIATLGIVFLGSILGVDLMEMPSWAK